MKEAIFFLMFFIIVVVFFLSGFVGVPVAHYGVVTRFGKRTGRVLSEGLNFVAPFIDKARLYSYELRTDSLDKISVFSEDRLDMELKGSVQWRPDKKTLVEFVEIPENTILIGLKDAIKSEIGKIAGEKEGDFFIKERKPLEMLINCIFRLQRPPHYFLNPIVVEEAGGEKIIKGYEFGDSFEKWITEKKEIMVEAADQEKIKKIEDARTGGKWDIQIENEKLDILKFYKENARWIQLMIELGEDERSSIEELYHIDISIFRLADVDFTLETKRALEKERQVKAEIVAAKQQQEWKLKIMDELMEKGLDAEKASNAADVIMGVAMPRQVISIEGGNVVPLMNITPQQKGGK